MLQEAGGGKALADELIDMVEGIAAAAPSKWAMAATPDQALANRAAGRLSFALGIENGAAIEDQLANLAHFHSRGVRYVTLTHGKNNLICDSSYEPADNRRWHGLSPFGREVVAEMNRLGIMVDLSHVSDEAFDQALALSQAPPIASHSSCRYFTPGFERNVDDTRIRALAAKGGVVQINFGSSFLTASSPARFWRSPSRPAARSRRSSSRAPIRRRRSARISSSWATPISPAKSCSIPPHRSPTSPPT